MMTFHPFQSFTAIGSILLILLLLELIRRRKLQDELWLPLLFIGTLPLVASIWISPWAALANWLGFAYEPALLLALGTVLSVLMFLYLAVVISKLLRRNLTLAQELAIIQLRLDSLGARGPLQSALENRDDRH